MANTLNAKLLINIYSWNITFSSCGLFQEGWNKVIIINYTIMWNYNVEVIADILYNLFCFGFLF